MAGEAHILSSVHRPAIIAGPCAAESRKQVSGTADALIQIPGLVAFRAGLWKPRTRPGDFEGVGEKGLEWLREVKESTGLKLAVEIAAPLHAERCLEAGVDIVWIGARSVVSPFVVDEIATALAGSKICVMVKNPVNPDLGLWAGALERLAKKGINELAAVHRGFDIYYSKPYRNSPLWEIPMALKQEFPEIPLFCDPSHIGGLRQHIPALSQKALDLGMDGLMIESHIRPDRALTDASQQILPAALRQIIDGLRVSDHIADGKAELEKYRAAIDDLDEQLLEILSKRMEIAELIGMYKKDRNLAPHQPERWKKLLADRRQKAGAMKLDPGFVKKIFDLIHMESIGRQE